MARDRSTLGTPLGVDGPWLAAILEALDDIADLLRKQTPQGETVGNEPNEILLGHAASEGPAEAAPAVVDSQADEDEPQAAAEPVKVSEPAPDNPPLPEPPPRAGRGASAEAWQTWAGRAGVAVADGATRADIIAACERAGVLPVEE